MNDFTFHNPTKVRFGRDQIRHLPEELKAFGTRVLLVYGGGSIKRSGLYDKLLGLMQEAGLTVFELPGVEPNPRHTTVNKGVQICRENQVDVILAVGGGSTIDCAKAVAATTFADTDNVWDIVQRKVTFDRALPIVTVVTIAATGSEMDTGAVISNMDLNVKSGLAAPWCGPGSPLRTRNSPSPCRRTRQPAAASTSCLIFWTWPISAPRSRWTCWSASRKRCSRPW